MGSPKPPYSVGSGPRDACPGVVAGASLGKERPQRGRRFTFVDDSLYSGGTYDYITSAIRLVGGEVDGAAVIYDGSPIRRQEVKSLYRYYCDGFCSSYHSSRYGGSRFPSGGVVRWRSLMSARGSSVCANHMGGPLRISPEPRFPDRW